MTILELREKRNTAWNAAKAFLDSHRTEKGTLTAEDDATYSRMEQEIADLGKEIARLERQEALEAELNKPVNKPLTSKPVTAAENAWKDYYTCYATVSAEAGKESTDAGLVVDDSKIDFTIRYCKKAAALTSTGYRIQFGNELYDILAVDHMNFKRKCIKLSCQKVRR